MCGLLPYHTVLHESDARRRCCARLVDAPNISGCLRSSRLPVGMSNKLLSLFDHLVWLSTLPTERHVHVTQTFDAVASQDYVALTKRQICHSRLVPLRARHLICVSTLHSVCKNFEQSLSRLVLEHVNFDFGSIIVCGLLLHHTTLCTNLMQEDIYYAFMTKLSTHM